MSEVPLYLPSALGRPFKNTVTPPGPLIRGPRHRFFMKCEVSGIRLTRNMEGRAEVWGFPMPLLWPRSAKMARNGAAESGRCSSGQWGAAEGGIGRAPAVSLGDGCSWKAPCKGQPMAGRRCKKRRIQGLQRAKKCPKLSNPGWAHSAQ